MPTNFTPPFRVLITDEAHRIAAETFEANGFEVSQVKKMTPQELAACIGDYDALVVRSSAIKDEAIFANAKRLKIIARAGTGYDNVDRKLATKYNIIVTNTPDGNAPSTAELTMGHMLNLARQIAKATANIQGGTWSSAIHKNDFQLRGKTLGIIGCGRIGSRVARHAISFGMNVIVYDPYILEGKVEGLAGKRAGRLVDLLRAADIITLHADLNDETRKIVNAETLAQCKRGVYILNCARGAMVDAAALAQAIKDGIVANAALDVIEDEPTKEKPDKWKANPLFEIGTVSFTPHLGGTTKESLSDNACQAAKQIIAYLCDGVIKNAVNEPFKHVDNLASIAPTSQMDAGEIIDGSDVQPEVAGFS